ncbi:MAG: right-handed parallel beta-helix repeat-containing protein [Chthoniobacter sp.]|uniref:right-handed parallel beta-helix repeat-containing protein n=1 Tax=Chthoniobacter sp. TaxID=2510640 RepID=UPI0032A866BA
MFRIPGVFLFCCALALGGRAGLSADYEIGPGQKLAALADVPWEKLGPGDVVTVHWRAEPYREKWVLCARGTEEKPIVVRGVANEKGELPVIDGEGAATPKALDYWGGERSVIKIGGANKPADTMPAYLVIENLDVRGARPPFHFHRRKGEQAYVNSAAAITIEKGEHITIRHCALHDSGNGLFAAPATRDLLVDGCRIFDNGIEGDIYEHNSYTEALGIVFQNCRFGPLRAGCPGNNLKDRSAGLVVRDNWIEGGNRALDLVDTGSPELRDAPSYRETFVFGNVLIKTDDAINNQVVHYGGDSGKIALYRQGTLHFFHNTVVSRRTGNTALFGLSTNEERVDGRNNIVWCAAGGARLALCDGPGQIHLLGNWLSRGFVNSQGKMSGEISGAENSLLGDTPGFADAAHDDFHLAPNSPCLGRAGEISPEILSAHPVKNPRDIGAFGAP